MGHRMETYKAVQEALRADMCQFVDWIVLQVVPAARVVESAYSKCFPFLRGMTDEHEIALWLVTMVRSEAIKWECDTCRKRGSEEVPKLRNPDSGLSRHEKLADHSVSVIRIYHAIRHLDRSSREILVLQSLFGCSQSEISAITGRSNEEVADSLSKSRRHLMTIAAASVAGTGNSPQVFSAHTRQALSDQFFNSSH